MKLWKAAMVAALLLVSTHVLAATPQVTIGDVVIRLPMDADQASLREQAPEVMQRLQDMLKQDMTVADALASSEDVERMRLGLPFRGYLYTYAYFPAFAKVRIDDRDWALGRPLLSKTIAGVDLDAEAEKVETALSEDIRREADVEARVEIGQIGKPVVFGNDPQAVKFSLALPIETTVEGASEHRLLGAECAIVRLKGKLVVLYVYHDREDEQSVRSLRAEMERTVERLRAANP